MIRQCKKCGEKKDILLFVKKKKKDRQEYYLHSCMECNKKYFKGYFKSYYQDHKDKLIKVSQKWYQDNLDKKKRYDKEYCKNNKLKKKEYDIFYRLSNKEKINNNRIYNYHINRRVNDPSYKLRRRLSCSIWYYLNLNGSSKCNESCIKFLPYSMQELKEYLEKKFEPWMNWSNYGSYRISLWIDDDPTTWKWNIDHIIPQSKLPYISMEDDNFKKCWALENLRPYSAKQNIIDSNKR